MKKINKILALALTLVLLLCLCACGGGGANFETRMQQAQEKMNSLKSMHMDMDMDLSMELSFMGQSQAMDMTAHYIMDMQKEPNRVKLDMDMSSMGSTESVTAYTDENGTSYLSMDGGKNWQKQSSQGAVVQTPQDPSVTMKLFAKNAKSFQKSGTETINGSPATVYSGVISGEYIQEIMQATGMGSALGESLGLGDMDGILTDLGDIPMTVAIDDNSGMVVRYTMDMAAVMEKLMGNLFDQMMAAQGMAGVKIEIKISRCMMTVTLSQFDSVPEIVIPDAAKAA